MIKPLIAILLLFSIQVFPQQKTPKVSDGKDTLSIKIIPDDFIKDSLQLTNHKEATLIDSLWLSSMYNSPLYDDFQFVDPDEKITDTIFNELPTELLKERLTYLNSKTPFHVEYNPSLENIIKHYLKTRKDNLSDLMGKASYYFPMFEEHLDKYDLPLEIKYLAIVESALKPRARSRVGATGLWQFMYYTGKQFNLDVS
ncbi:MAG: transglycosylase SLT domain-containing protein, partial [Flavobacteriaceae bacterium]|nr:transglycosylase SLT domain-containing protein [Flavobacteriaceae bacterium]